MVLLLSFCYKILCQIAEHRLKDDRECNRTVLQTYPTGIFHFASTRGR